MIPWPRSPRRRRRKPRAPRGWRDCASPSCLCGLTTSSRGPWARVARRRPRSAGIMPLRGVPSTSRSSCAGVTLRSHSSPSSGCWPASSSAVPLPSQPPGASAGTLAPPGVSWCWPRPLRRPSWRQPTACGFSWTWQWPRAPRNSTASGRGPAVTATAAVSRPSFGPLAKRARPSLTPWMVRRRPSSLGSVRGRSRCWRTPRSSRRTSPTQSSGCRSHGSSSRTGARARPRRGPPCVNWGSNSSVAWLSWRGMRRRKSTSGASMGYRRVDSPPSPSA
mmetsp:Transcript_86887/g.243439  ORF Transcript_86887/g.243439 Transcript_86887/m.243439 type:complete len:277 (-) Transcript_86887:686-1516(-)